MMKSDTRFTYLIADSKGISDFYFVLSRAGLLLSNSRLFDSQLGDEVCRCGIKQGCILCRVPGQC